MGASIVGSNAGAATPWPQASQASAVDPAPTSTLTKPELIQQLLAVVAKGTLTDQQTATLMLEAGPQGTAEAFQWWNATKRDHQSLPPVQRGRLEPALKAAPKVLLRIALLPQLGAAKQHHVYTVALEVIVGLGGAASAQDLTAVLQGAGASSVAPSLRTQVSSAVARLTTESQVGSTEASSWLKAAGLNLSTAVVDGLSEAKAVMTLIGCLGTNTGAEGAILNRAAGLIQRGEPVATEAAALQAVPFLRSDNAFERAESSTIVGLVGDRRHVKQLIVSLDDSEHMVRTNALKALKNLTGMTISGDASRWQQWHLEQESWWENTGAGLVDSLGSAGRRELIGILKEVSTRRLYRREITARLLPMLNRNRADEIRVVVASLATLRDPACLTAILELRDHHDPKVRSTVEDALVAFRHSGIKASRVKALPRQ